MRTHIATMNTKLFLGIFVGSVLLSACSENPLNSETVIVDEKNKNLENSDIALPEETIALEDEVGYGSNPGLATSNEARDDFENFYKSSEGVTIIRNVAKNRTGEQRTDQLSMDYNTYIGLYRTDIPVVAGTTFNGMVDMWTNPGEEARIVLQISNFCTSENPEVSSVSATLTQTPSIIDISHTFENEHGCALFRITNVTEGGAVIYAASATFSVDEQKRLDEPANNE